MEQFLRKTGKTAFTASDSKYNVYTGRSSHSGLHSVGITKSNKEFFSDDNIEDNSDNQNL
jgi:hypothetical protein